MTTPSKSEIDKKAIELYFQHEKEYITPEKAELAESGFTYEAKLSLMRNEEKAQVLSYVESMANEHGYTLKKESEAYLKACVKHSTFEIPFDLKEAEKSNILVSGSNHTGKTRLACGIASIVRHFDWSVVVLSLIHI